MLTILFTILLFLHGAIHLLGFVKEWNLAPVKQLTGKTLVPLSGTMPKVFGALWLEACLLFFITAVMLLFKLDWWMIAALPAVIVSQTLIIFYWQDAKAGTIANVIITIALVVSYAEWNFDRKANDEIKALLASAHADNKDIVREETIAELPPIIRKWLERSNVIGREKIQTVRLKQQVAMRTRQDGSWISTEAEQYFTIETPAFIWKATVHAAPSINIAARDKYQNGKGNMLIKALGLISIADSKGAEMDQGTMLRFLGETTWFPTAALSNYITWEAIDSISVSATMIYGGVTASGIFIFDQNGDVVNFQAQRYGEFDGKFSLETWSIAVSNHKEMSGIRIPTEAEVTWKLKSGDFTWFRAKITEVQYNMPSPFQP